MFKAFWDAVKETPSLYFAPLREWWKQSKKVIDEEHQRLVEWAEANLAALDWTQQGDLPMRTLSEPSRTAQEPLKQPCTTCPSFGPCQKHQEASDALEEKSHGQN